MHERYRQTDRQTTTDGRQHSEREREFTFTFAKNGRVTAEGKGKLSREEMLAFGNVTSFLARGSLRLRAFVHVVQRASNN